MHRGTDYHDMEPVGSTGSPIQAVHNTLNQLLRLHNTRAFPLLFSHHRDRTHRSG
jgi:hypothetical protein